MRGLCHPYIEPVIFAGVPGKHRTSSVPGYAVWSERFAAMTIGAVRTIGLAGASSIEAACLKDGLDRL